MSDFKVDDYFLMAATPINDSLDPEFYFLSSCITSYLRMDKTGKEAYGNYSLIRKMVSISAFERKLKYGDWDLPVLGSVVVISLTTLLIIRRNKKS